MKPSTGTVTSPPITPPSPSVEASRKTVARVACSAADVGGAAAAPRGRSARVSGSTVRRLARAGCRREVAHPEEREDDRDDGADARRSTRRRRSRRAARRCPRRSPPARGSGPGRADVRGSAPSRLATNITSAPLSTREQPRSNYAESARCARAAGIGREAVLGPARGRRARGSPALISISGGHSRAPSSGPFAVASIPSLPPTNWRVVAWSRWSAGPSVSTTSRAGSTLAPT